MGSGLRLGKSSRRGEVRQLRSQSRSQGRGPVDHRQTRFPSALSLLPPEEGDRFLLSERQGGEDSRRCPVWERRRRLGFLLFKVHRALGGSWHGVAHRRDRGPDDLQLDAGQGGLREGVLLGLQAEAANRGARGDAPERRAGARTWSGARRGRSTAMRASRSQATRRSAAFCPIAKKLRNH